MTHLHQQRCCGVFGVTQESEQQLLSLLLFGLNGVERVHGTLLQLSEEQKHHNNIKTEIRTRVQRSVRVCVHVSNLQLEEDFSDVSRHGERSVSQINHHRHQTLRPALTAGGKVSHTHCISQWINHTKGHCCEKMKTRKVLTCADADSKTQTLPLPLY